MSDFGYVYSKDKVYDLGKVKDLKEVQKLLNWNVSGAWGQWQRDHIKDAVNRIGMLYSLVRPEVADRLVKNTSTLTYVPLKPKSIQSDIGIPSIVELPEHWTEYDTEPRDVVQYFPKEDKNYIETPVTNNLHLYTLRYKNAKEQGQTIRTFKNKSYDISNPVEVGKLLYEINKYLGVDHLDQDNKWGPRVALALTNINEIKAYYDEKRKNLKAGEVLTPDRDAFVTKINGKFYGTTARNNGGFLQEYDESTGTYKTRDARTDSKGAISINNTLYDLNTLASEVLKLLGLLDTGIWTEKDENDQINMFSRLSNDYVKLNKDEWTRDFNSNLPVTWHEDGIDYSGKWIRDKIDNTIKAHNIEDLSRLNNNSIGTPGAYNMLGNALNVINDEINWDLTGQEIQSELENRFKINLSPSKQTFNQNSTNYTKEQIEEILALPENQRYVRALNYIQNAQKYIAKDTPNYGYWQTMFKKIADNTILGALNNVNKYYQNKDKNQSEFSQGVKALLYQKEQLHLLDIGWNSNDENIANLVGIAVDLIPDLFIDATTFGTGTAALETVKLGAKGAAQAAMRKAIINAGERKLSREVLKNIGKEAADLYVKQNLKTVTKTGIKEAAYWTPRGTVVSAGNQAQNTGNIDWNEVIKEGLTEGATAGVLGGTLKGVSNLSKLSPGFNKVQQSVKYGLGGYGLYDSSTDMYNNGINIGNSLEMIGSTIPFVRSIPIKFNSKLFDPKRILLESRALNIKEKSYNIPTSPKDRYGLILRYNTPKLANNSINFLQDFGASIAGQKLSNNLNNTINQNWNPTSYFGNLLKNFTNYSIGALGTTVGFNARKGNTFRNTLSGTVAFGPGSYLTNLGFNYIENKLGYDELTPWYWNIPKKAGEFIIPALISHNIEKGFAKHNLNTGNYTLQDQQLAATSNKQSLFDNTVNYVKALPIIWGLDYVLPENMTNKDNFINQFGYHTASNVHLRNGLANMMNRSGGSLSPKQVTIPMVEGALAGDLNTYIYSGRYIDGSANTMGNTKNGSIFGVEGLRRNKTYLKPIKPVRTSNMSEAQYLRAMLTYQRRLDAWNRMALVAESYAGGNNYGELNNSNTTWWDIFTGKKFVKAGDSFGKDSFIRRAEMKTVAGNDFASKQAASFNKNIPFTEIRVNSKLLGKEDVPAEVEVLGTRGVPRSDAYFTGPNGESLNTVGANLVLYGKNGRIEGIQIVDYLNPGVRRISPTTSTLGKISGFIAHPWKSITGRMTYDNYYNKTPDRMTRNLARDEKGNVSTSKLDILQNKMYLFNSLMTEIASRVKRNNVVNTTGYKKLSELTNLDSKHFEEIANIILGTTNSTLPYSKILNNYKKVFNLTGTKGEIFEHFINNLNLNYSGNNLNEKFINFINSSSGRKATKGIILTNNNTLTNPRIINTSLYRKHPEKYKDYIALNKNLYIYKDDLIQDFIFEERLSQPLIKKATIKTKQKLLNFINELYKQTKTQKELNKDYKLLEKLSNLRKNKLGKYTESSKKTISKLSLKDKEYFEKIGVLDPNSYKLGGNIYKIYFV